MRNGYGQYCPLALAAELLCERWTILVVSRLIDGCRRFNDIHRGVPKISATLLAQRLSRLEDAGLVERRPLPTGRGHEYLLTEAGRELEPLVTGMAVWGQRWARDMVSDDLDPAFLAWSMHTRLNTSAFPEGRTVMEFLFTGTPAELRRFWLIQDDGAIDMCLKHPGFETDIAVEADIRTFVEAWRGFRDLRREIACGRIHVHGPPELRRALPRWLELSSLARHERMRDGEEQQLRARAPSSVASG